MSSNPSLPLISCLCVTRNKTAQLKRAIGCFMEQTYPAKELLIVYEDDDIATREYLSSINDKDIRQYEVPSAPKLTLGHLRNISILQSRGEYFCQWDDDDWYHETRLSVQLDALFKSHKPACFLVYWLMYDQLRNKSFMSHIGPWPGTIMCRKSIIGGDFKYSEFKKHEDYVLMAKLIEHRYAFPLIMPSLYIYSYHGNNTFSQAHFDQLFNGSQPFSPYITEFFRKTFTGELSCTEASKILNGPLLHRDLDYFYGNELKAIESDDEFQSLINS